MSDDDDDKDVRKDVQKPAPMGASGEDAHTGFESKLRRHLRSRHHHDSASTQHGSQQPGSRPQDSAQQSQTNQGSKAEQDGDDDYHHQFEGHHTGLTEAKAGEKT